jgi:hypothetical protein
MTPTERRYRRVLRLLPAGYRELWEEDMVSSYLDGVADSRRRPVGEALSVAWLALGLRFNGSHAATRSRSWRHSALGIAMLATVYESLNATIRFATIAWQHAALDTDASWQNQIAYWWDALSLLWVATFVCLVLGRLAAARALVLVTVAYELGPLGLIVKSTFNPSWWVWPGMLLEHSAISQAWLCLTAAAVFLASREIRPPRRWLAAYIVAAALVVPVALASVTGPDEPSWPQWLARLQWVNVGTLLHITFIVGMITALVTAHRWLFPLAAFGGGIAAGQLLGHSYGGDFLYELRQHGTQLWTWVNVTQLGLAVACAIAGLVTMRRAGAATATTH